MAQKNIAALIEEISAPVVEELGFELVDVEFVKEGGSWILRVLIDKNGGIGHADCEIVSKRLDSLLDEVDPIAQSYFLEVSSPGIERPLKKPEDFQRYAGYPVKVTTYAAVEGRKVFTGKLGSVENGVLIVEEKDKKIAIPRVQVSSVRLFAGI